MSTYRSLYLQHVQNMSTTANLNTAKEVFHKAVRIISAFKPKPKPKAKRPESLEIQLETAERAENWDPRSISYYGVEFPRLAWSVPEAPDGLWRCHCGTENPLVHYKGAFPFKYLTCGCCDHVICERCDTTEILTKVSSTPSTQSTPSSNQSRHKLLKEESRCLTVCQACGLSHREQLENGQALVPHHCACGSEFKGSEPQYFIGSAYEWRRDPAARAVSLSVQRFRAVE